MNEYNQLLELLKQAGILNPDLSQHGRSSSNLEKNPTLYAKVSEATSFFEYDIDTKGRISALQMGLTFQPKCETCDAVVKIRTTGRLARTYPRFCAGGCSNKADSVKQKKEQSSFAHYGTKNISQAPEIKQKKEETNLDRRGVKYSLSDLSIREQIKQTCVERYGGVAPIFDNGVKSKQNATCNERYGANTPFESREIQERIKLHNNSVYGVNYPFQSDGIREKIKNSFRMKYGVDYPFQNPSILESYRRKAIESCNIKYGVDYPFQNKDISQKSASTLKLLHNDPAFVERKQQRLRDTNKDRYGFDYYPQRKMSEASLTNINNREWLITQHHKLQKALWKIAEELHVATTTVCRYVKRFDIDIKTYPSSQGERDLADWIKTVYEQTQVITNTRQVITPKELDIYLPEKNLAIEYNGRFFHSTVKRSDIDSMYHLDKTQTCNNKGIDLIHIFDNEWNDKQHIVKHLIKKRFQPIRLVDNLTIDEVSSQTADEFYRLHGFDSIFGSSDVNFAVNDKDSILAVYSLNMETLTVEMYAETEECTNINVKAFILDVFTNVYSKDFYILYNRRLGYPFEWLDLGLNIVGTTPPQELYPNVWDCGCYLLQL